MKSVIKSYITNDATRSIRWASIPPTGIGNRLEIWRENTRGDRHIPHSNGHQTKECTKMIRFAVKLTPQLTPNCQHRSLLCSTLAKKLKTPLTNQIIHSNHMILQSWYRFNMN